LEYIGDLVIHILFESGRHCVELASEFGAEIGDFLTDHASEVILHVCHDLFAKFFGVGCWVVCIGCTGWGGLDRFCVFVIGGWGWVLG